MEYNKNQRNEKHGRMNKKHREQMGKLKDLNHQSQYTDIAQFNQKKSFAR